MTDDASNGYDAVAEAYMAARSRSGCDAVHTWAASLAPGSSVVDVGAGHGEPLTPVLIDAGLTVRAIDASPKMVAAFQRRFPDIEIACEQAERSAFFGRTFDAALSIGLIFLLPERRQSDLLGRISDALKPGGKLFFSAPWQVGTWDDLLTKQPSWSLGAVAYEQILIDKGMRLTDKYVDDAGTHYYGAERI